MRALNVLFALLLIGIAFADISVTNYAASQDSFKPGGQGYITLTVTNPSSGVGKGMTGVLASITAPPELTMSSSQFIGDIETGGSTIVTIPFRIKDNAKSGIYSIAVRISGYSEEREEGSQSFYSRTVSIPIKIVNPPLFSIATDQKILTGLDDVNFTIKNDGGVATDLQVSINGTGGIALYGINQIYVGKVENLSSFMTTLDSRNVADGPLDIPLRLSYYDELGNPKSETVYVRATVKKAALDLLFIQDERIVTRKESAFSLRVKNNGNSSLNDVKITFLGQTFRLKDKNELNLGSIPAGGESSASGIVFADLSPGLNQVPARISWVERDVTKEQEITIPLTITSDADVGVYIETKPAPLEVGREYTLSVLVSNLGSYAIDNVDVEISSDVLRSLDITNKQYIGSLAKDDFSTVQFKTNVRNDIAPGDYSMSIKVRYRDQSGEWVTKTISQPITIYPPTTNNSGSALLYVGVFAILVIAVWYFFLRKKQRA